MNFFKGLALIFGLVALLKPFYMHILPWDENKFIAKAYTKKRPGWVVPVALVGLLFVAFTWYKHLTMDVPYSLVITVLFSLTAIKAIAFLFNYDQFQQWVANMLKKDKGRDIVIVDIFAGLFGLVLVLLGLFLY